MVFVTQDRTGLSRSDFTAVRAPFATPNEYARALWEQTVVPYQVRHRHIDLYHSPNYILPLMLSCPTVVTIHDVIFRSLPRFHRWQARLYLSFFTAWAVRRADRLIAVSKTTASELARYYPVAAGKTHVIYQGLDPIFRSPPPPKAVQDFRSRNGIEQPYILFVGTLEPRKNLLGLLEAYRQLVDGWNVPHELVICGAVGWHDRPFWQALDRSPVGRRVRLAGYVTHEELPYWYAAADLFVYPSLFEGFGLPPLEAMACGVPVIASGVSSLPEAVGDAAVLVDPTDAQAIAEGMAEVLQSSSLADSLRTRGFQRARQFDWRVAAGQIMGLYREVMST